MVIHAVLAIVNVPFVTAYFTKSVPRQIVDCGRRGIPRSNIRWPTGHSEGAATGGAHGRRWGMKPPRLYRRAGSCQRVVTCERAPYTSTPSGRSPEPLASTAFGRQPCFAKSGAFVTLMSSRRIPRSRTQVSRLRLGAGQRDYSYFISTPTLKKRSCDFNSAGASSALYHLPPSSVQP